MEQAGQAPRGGWGAGLTTLRDQGEAVGASSLGSLVSWEGGNSRLARRLVGGTAGCCLFTPRLCKDFHRDPCAGVDPETQVSWQGQLRPQGWSPPLSPGEDGETWFVRGRKQNSRCGMLLKLCSQRIFNNFRIYHKWNESDHQAVHRIGFFVKYLYLMYIDIHVPIKKTESLTVVFSVVGLCVFIIFIFKHFLSIHVINIK